MRFCVSGGKDRELGWVGFGVALSMEKHFHARYVCLTL